MSDIPEDAKVPPEMRLIDESKFSAGKYSPKLKQDFPDPVVRCDSCHVIVHRQHIHRVGCCPECGNRRFRNVLTLKEQEMEDLKKTNIDPEFLALFEGVQLESV